MPKLRKMLGDINSQECISLMRLIETQSKKTLADWAVNYAEQHYLTIYKTECPDDIQLQDTINACKEFLSGSKKLAEIKPYLKEATQIARSLEGSPVAQAAARAVSTACATVQTPTNALGFLFYGAAATAYHQAGISETPELYDALASKELNSALTSLQEIAIPDEPNPAKIKWSC